VKFFYLGWLVIASAACSSAQTLPSPSPGKALIYIYHQNDRYGLPAKSKVYVNHDFQHEVRVRDPSTYAVFEVSAPFPMSLEFAYQFIDRPVPIGAGSSPAMISCFATGDDCPAEFLTMARPLQIQVEAGKVYYIQYSQGLPTPSGGLVLGGIALVKEAVATKQMVGFRPTETRYFAPLTAEQAIHTLDVDLTNATREDTPDGCERQPLQRITVTKDGFQFLDVGKAPSFGKKEYSVKVTMQFNGHAYLRLGYSDALDLPIDSFVPKPGSAVVHCINKLRSNDLMGLIEAINTLIWEEGKSQDDTQTAH
jgi:hypothetical protein